MQRLFLPAILALIVLGVNADRALADRVTAVGLTRSIVPDTPPLLTLIELSGPPDQLTGTLTLFTVVERQAVLVIANLTGEVTGEGLIVAEGEVVFSLFPPDIGLDVEVELDPVANTIFIEFLGLGFLEGEGRVIHLAR